MLYYKAYRSRSYLAGGLHHVGSHQAEHDHHQVDQILHDRGSVLSAAKGGQDEEDGQPDDKFTAHEHAGGAADQGEEAGAIGLLLHCQPGLVVVHYIFGINPAHINNL